MYVGEICMPKSSAVQNQKELIALLKPGGVFFTDHLMLAGCFKGFNSSAHNDHIRRTNYAAAVWIPMKQVKVCRTSKICWQKANTTSTLIAKPVQAQEPKRNIRVGQMWLQRQI